MDIAPIFVALMLQPWLSVFVTGATFSKANQSPKLTTMVGITIPDATTHLRFEKNVITNIPSNYLNNLPSLGVVHLYENMISSIDDYAWALVPSVWYINLGDNQLSIIRKRHFAGLPNLKTLYLDANLVHTIQDHSFKENMVLATLDLEDNSVQTLKQSIFDPAYRPCNLYIKLKNNPLVCDGDICWVKQEGWVTVGDASLAECGGPAPLTGRKWDTITESEICPGKVSLCKIARSSAFSQTLHVPQV